MDFKQKTLDKITQKASETLDEICGFLILTDGEEYVISAKNAASNKEKFFAIDSEEWYPYRKQILAIYHSHTASDENPSEFDRRECWATQIPFLIYSTQTKKFHYLKPEDCYYG